MSVMAGPVVARAAPVVEVGMNCTVADGWWSLDRERPVQPEPVKVVAIKALTTGAPGVWVQPSRGKLTEHQLHIAPPPRALLSFVLILGLLAIVRCGEQATVKVMSLLVYPFIVALALLG